MASAMYPLKPCRYGLQCWTRTCPFAHPSPREYQPQSPLSPDSLTPSKQYNDDFDEQDVQDSSYAEYEPTNDGYYPDTTMPTQMSARVSDHSSSSRMVASQSRFSKIDLSHWYASVKSPLVLRVLDEIDALFHVCAFECWAFSTACLLLRREQYPM